MIDLYKIDGTCCEVDIVRNLKYILCSTEKSLYINIEVMRET